MCTLVFAYKVHPRYDLIFLGNRDEFKNRPTESAHFWQSNPSILAGIDLEKGGTWTGITRQGRMAFITNHRNFSLSSVSKLSRGYLTRDFLAGNTDSLDYLKNLEQQRREYAPYNLIVGTLAQLWFYSNIEDQIRLLPAGLYGLSNGFLDTPWPKVIKAKSRLAQLITAEFTLDQLFSILADTEQAPDEALPDTGTTLELERMLSSIHIDSPNYGTRFKTIILIDKSGRVEFHEASLDEQRQWKQLSFQFQLEQ